MNAIRSFRAKMPRIKLKPSELKKLPAKIDKSYAIELIINNLSEGNVKYGGLTVSIKGKKPLIFN